MAAIVKKSFQHLYSTQQLRMLSVAHAGFTAPTAFSPATVYEGSSDETSHSSADFCSGDLPAFGGSAVLLSLDSLPFQTAASVAQPGVALNLAPPTARSTQGSRSTGQRFVVRALAGGFTEQPFGERPDFRPLSRFFAADDVIRKYRRPWFIHHLHQSPGVYLRLRMQFRRVHFELFESDANPAAIARWVREEAQGTL